MTPRSEYFLSSAIEIAYRIADQAVWHEGRCNWVGAEPIERRDTSYFAGAKYKALSPDLYSGTSGVAVCLAEMSAVTKEDKFRRMALGAVRQAFSRADAIPFHLRIGLFTGWTGIALAAARIGVILDEPTFLDQAVEMVHGAISGNIDRDQFDLMSGRAGAIAVLVTLHDAFNDAVLLEYAIRLGDELLESADKTDRGYSWKSPGLGNWHNLTGFSHGTAGAAYALLELFHATGMDRFRDAASLAFQYERHWFDPSVENWPDFRRDPNSSRRKMRSHRHMTFWCHGAPGIALSRLRAYEILGDATFRAEANLALKTTRAAVELAMASGDDNFSLCHGLAGNAEALQYGTQLLDSARGENSATVVKAAEYGTERYSACQGGWPCGTHGGETPNLMLGLAGICHFYLRLYEPSIPSILILRKEAWKSNLSAVQSAELVRPSE